MRDEILASVKREVLGRPGIRTGPSRFGSTADKFGRREIGHDHRHGAPDFPRSQRTTAGAARSRTRPALIRRYDGRAKRTHVRTTCGVDSGLGRSTISCRGHAAAIRRIGADGHLGRRRRQTREKGSFMNGYSAPRAGRRTGLTHRHGGRWSSASVA